MTDHEMLAKLTEQQKTTNAILTDIHDLLDCIAENLIQLRKGTVGDAEAPFIAPIAKHNEALIDCARKSFTARAGLPDEVRMWADDYAERSVW